MCNRVARSFHPIPYKRVVVDKMVHAESMFSVSNVRHTDAKNKLIRQIYKLSCFPSTVHRKKNIICTEISHWWAVFRRRMLNLSYNTEPQVAQRTDAAHIFKYFSHYEYFHCKGNWSLLCTCEIFISFFRMSWNENLSRVSSELKIQEFYIYII
jgi:hypothetical protein